MTEVTSLLRLLIKKGFYIVPQEVSCIWHNNSVGISKLYLNEKGEINIPGVDLFSTDQAILFAEHIIRTEEQFRMFSGYPNTVGGKIQILVLERGNRVKCKEI